MPGFGDHRRGGMRQTPLADIFISYTRSDRDRAFWIATDLRALGHEPHVHEWEIVRSGDRCRCATAPGGGAVAGRRRDAAVRANPAVPVRRSPRATGRGPLLAGRGRERSVAALRRFGLVELDTVADERDPAITAETIRLHRLIRMAARWRRDAPASEAVRAGLIEALVAVFPDDTFVNPATWPRARRLGAIVLGTADEVGDEYGSATAGNRAVLLERLGSYNHAAGDYPSARPLFERALAISEKVLGAEHPDTASSLNTLAGLLLDHADLAAARPLFERALAISEKVLGAEHQDTADTR
jgi:hypothetical protein